jgi:hypothetical protein
MKKGTIIALSLLGGVALGFGAAKTICYMRSKKIAAAEAKTLPENATDEEKSEFRATNRNRIVKLANNAGFVFHDGDRMGGECYYAKTASWGPCGQK